jgi:anthranilate synthase/aminodeoxychorismate synthase-like glutamine amidotransferase
MNPEPSRAGQVPRGPRAPSEPSQTGQVPRGPRGAGAPSEPSQAGQVSRGARARRVLIIDNYDSFTFNLVQYLGELGAEPDVVRNDAETVDALLGRGAERLIVSPGPCTPAEAGVSTEAVRRFAEEGTPVLGVCLGHQALAAAFGGRVVRGEPVHGKAGSVAHDGRTIFAGLDSPLVAGRYHSLVVDPELPPELERSASLGETVMAIRHRELPAEGVQFHPESVLTEDGMAILRNFLRTDD